MSRNSLNVHKFCLTHTQMDRWLRMQIAHALEKTGLTMMEWLLLMTVSTQKLEGLTITAAAESLGVSLPQITALTQQLRQKKLLSQRVEAGDRRSRRLQVSPEGQTICLRGQRRIEEVIEDVSEAPQLHSYKRLLTLLVEQPTGMLE